MPDYLILFFVKKPPKKVHFLKIILVKFLLLRILVICKKCDKIRQFLGQLKTKILSSTSFLANLLQYMPHIKTHGNPEY